MKNMFVIIGIISTSIVMYLLLPCLGDFQDDARLNAVILTATLLSILWYTIETNKMQRNTERQIELSRNTLSVDLIMKLDDRFNGAEFKAIRKRAAERIAAHIGSRRDMQDAITESITGHPYDIEDILDFFETIGHLVTENLLSQKLVWHTFLHWSHRYTLLARGYMLAEQRSKPTVYRDLIELDHIMTELEAETGGDKSQAEINLSDEAVREFLVEETSLL